MIDQWYKTRYFVLFRPRTFSAPLRVARCAVQAAGYRTALHTNAVVLNTGGAFPLVLKQFIGDLLFCQVISGGLEIVEKDQRRNLCGLTALTVNAVNSYPPLMRNASYPGVRVRTRAGKQESPLLKRAFLFSGSPLLMK